MRLAYFFSSLFLNIRHACLIMIVFLNLSLVSFQAFSQEKYDKIIELSVESGPFISNGDPWADELIDLVSYTAFDFRFGWRQNKTFMGDLYRNPIFGIGVSSTLPYQSEIGRPMGVYWFFDIPFRPFSQDKRFNFSYFAHLGLGFNLNPYDSLDNPINQFIGSELNSYIHFGAKANYTLSDRFQLFSMLGLKHFSNGSTRKPNAGINLVPVSIGLRYNFQPSQVKPEEAFLRDRSILFEKGYWNFMLYTGSKNYEIGEGTYFRGGFNLSYIWDKNYKYRYGMGLDVFFAPGLSERTGNTDVGFWDQTSVAIAGAWEWKLTERLYAPVGLGFYIHRNRENQESTVYYERVGLRYLMSENLQFGVQIKAHRIKADFFEFTLGYRFLRKQ